jgi:peptidoglycan-associated lipoprotein
MQKWIGSVLLLLIAALPAAGQVPAGHSPTEFDLSAGYTFVRSNALAGGCGCFLMNGGTGEAALNFKKGIGAVADFSAIYNGNVVSSGQKLLLVSYLFGPRYSFHSGSRFTPFAQALIGGAHASGLGYSGATGPGSAIAAAAGGGLDLGVNRRLAVRLFEVDYNFMHFQNAVNSRESLLRITFGVVLRFGKN